LLNWRINLSTLRLGLQQGITEEFASTLQPGHSGHLLFKAMLFSKTPPTPHFFETSERKTELSHLTVDVNNLKYAGHLTDGKTNSQ